MKKTDLRKTVVRWAKQIGEGPAARRLMDRKLSSSTAEKLVHGRYPAEPKELVRSILVEELEKDGFTLTSEVAS